jgi:Arf-GAP/coiled-coil/ANK repeat/PH domain-containing protein
MGLVGAGARANGDGDDDAVEVEPPEPLEVLAQVPGNDKCADCGAADPDWASLNLCVVICQKCAGVHRHLGAHISKVGPGGYPNP